MILCHETAPRPALNGGIYRTTNAKGAGTFADVRPPRVSGARHVRGEPRRLHDHDHRGHGRDRSHHVVHDRRRRAAPVGGRQPHVVGEARGRRRLLRRPVLYDLPVAISPTDPNIILLGGAGNGTCSRVYARSANAGVSFFTAAGVADVGLPYGRARDRVRPGRTPKRRVRNDGGIWKSTNGGVSWTSLNIFPFSASQYQKHRHPTDPNFSRSAARRTTAPSTTCRTARRPHRASVTAASRSSTRMRRTTRTCACTTRCFNQRNNLAAYGIAANVASAFDGNRTVVAIT